MEPVKWLFPMRINPGKIAGWFKYYRVNEWFEWAIYKKHPENVETWTIFSQFTFQLLFHAQSGEARPKCKIEIIKRLIKLPTTKFNTCAIAQSPWNSSWYKRLEVRWYQEHYVYATRKKAVMLPVNVTNRLKCPFFFPSFAGRTKQYLVFGFLPVQHNETLHI